MVNSPANKLYFIVNPVSGPPGKRMTKERLHRLLLLTGIQADIEQTSYAGHAPELALAALQAGYQTIVAVGGDGTVNETAGALCGTPAKLGIVPRGSGNGLARHLGIPMEAIKALGVIKAGSCIKIDSGLINGKQFFCTAGIGFDGLISGVFAASKKRGLVTYALLGISNYFSYKPVKASITAANVQIESKPFAITIANAAQYGNNAYIAPKASVQDGELDICVVPALSIIKAMQVGVGLFTRTLNNLKAIHYYKCTEATVQTELPCAYHTDGEYAGNADYFEIKIIPSCLHIIKPEENGQR